MPSRFQLDKSPPLARLSEVENRSWVHVERVRVITPQQSRPAIFPRPDVAAAFPEARHAEASGFAIPLANPPWARFKLQLECTGPHENWNTFFDTVVAASGKMPTNLENSRPPGAPPASDRPHPGFYLWFDEPLDWTKLARRFRVSEWSGPLLVRAERGGA